jgi:cytochrome P450
MTRRVNLLSDDFRANPYPRYAELRRSHPVLPVEPAGLWAVSRYEDVAFVLNTPQLFSPEGIRTVWEPAWLGYNPMVHTTVALESAAAHPLQAWMNEALGPAALQRLEPRVRQFAEALVEELAPQARTDFIASFALPLPALVLSELLGLNAADYRQFKNWSDDFACVLPKVPSDDALRIRHTVTRLTGHLAQLLEEEREAPPAEGLRGLLRAGLQAGTMSQREGVELMTFLLVTGLETSVPLLANALLLLAEQPEVLASLRADRSLVPAFIAELLRYDPPVHGILRTTLEPVTLSGVALPAGAVVLALTASAGRDEGHYAEAGRFMLHREQPAPPFDWAHATCPVATLASLMARVGVEALLARFEGFAVLTEDLSWNKALTVRSPHALPLALTPSATGAASGATSSAWVGSP